jgi:hypothetical protein
MDTFVFFETQHGSIVQRKKSSYELHWKKSIVILSHILKKNGRKRGYLVDFLRTTQESLFIQTREKDIAQRIKEKL